MTPCVHFGCFGCVWSLFLVFLLCFLVVCVSCCCFLVSMSCTLVGGGCGRAGDRTCWCWVGGSVVALVECCLGVAKNRLGTCLFFRHIMIKCLKLCVILGGWCVH